MGKQRTKARYERPEPLDCEALALDLVRRGLCSRMILEYSGRPRKDRSFPDYDDIFRPTTNP